ncbi:glycoside hydrolase family 31 protein [Calidifontibacillus oryziterrae]|uniref:glycoside hydrolase family 31 protein n=1 Tax=Calidifontibacillus oryziterrae TaxID=1191699 RepID=UPI00030D6CCF|nr:glycoside hydrolase family 31 protein [Calidifontibacillus oryziterrae]
MFEDSSFAIHPNKLGKSMDSRYHDIGEILSFEQQGHVYIITCKNGFMKIVFYQNDIVRIVMNPLVEPSLKSSVAVIEQPKKISVKLQQLKDRIILTSTKLSLELFKTPCRLTIRDETGEVLLTEGSKGIGTKATSEVVCYKVMTEDDHFYGFGEKTGYLNKRGEKMVMWNTDVYAPHNPETDPLYQSIPFFMAVRNGSAYGIFFDNTFKTTFDFKTETDLYSFSANGGQLDYYVFSGPSPKDVVRQYTHLTGRMPLPPKWALGYHQSKYSYMSESEVRELIHNFIEKDIPVDAIYLDIHYMDEYRVFTFDQHSFPNPQQLIADLKSKGIHLIPIVDPGVKKDPSYNIYKDGILKNHFCKYLEGDIYIDEVWPGESAFPDFSKTETQKWWADNHTFYTDLGIEGIWNDMNEPAVFNNTKTMDLEVIHDNDGDIRTHAELHNLYGLLMGMSTYNGLVEQLQGKRPFLLTRAGYSGIQRYAAVWTGDNRSFWEHLEMSLPMCMNLGISGVAFCGPDVGGFAHDCNGQLLTRWIQVGAFTPFFRNHNALDTNSQEPWAFGAKYESIIRKYIQLRYRWLPHLYTLFSECSRTGIPVMRPLVLEYPGDKHVWNLSDQFMIGENVIIAPILRPDTFHRVVYLPDGEWINYWTDQVLIGDKHLLIEADLETLPIFIKKGAIIAQGASKQSTMVAETDMQIHIYPDENVASSYTLYDDDGTTFNYMYGQYFEKKITCMYSGDTLNISVENIISTYKPSWKQWKLIVHLANENTKLFINKKQIPNENIIFHHESHTIEVTVDQ